MIGIVGASVAKLGALNEASETRAVAIRRFFMVPPGIDFCHACWRFGRAEHCPRLSLKSSGFGKKILYFAASRIFGSFFGRLEVGPMPLGRTTLSLAKDDRFGHGVNEAGALINLQIRDARLN